MLKYFLPATKPASESVPQNGLDWKWIVLILIASAVIFLLIGMYIQYRCRRKPHGSYRSVVFLMFRYYYLSDSSCS